MSEAPRDQLARERFRDAWDINFAVNANAGSGKTTAISERLAAIALGPDAAQTLQRTAVVTFTKKAAAQIGQRARQVLMRRLEGDPAAGLAPLDHLERAFFGTIHSFCLLLAQRYGQTLGIHLNPVVVDEDDDALWEEFLEKDPMQFSRLGAVSVRAFLRHTALDSIFGLARRLDGDQARRFVAKPVAERPPGLPPAVLEEIRGAQARKGAGALALQRNQQAAGDWARQFASGSGYLPIPEPQGTAAGIKALYGRLFAPLKTWLADAGSVLAAELALRYRAWRLDRGVQTYADQVEAALAVLHDKLILERIRAEGWRVLLDEAQDTDPQQFAVLVEITRPPGSALGTWPARGGPGPLPGRFCMVGDSQQAIYGARADIDNFRRHIEAFDRGDGGELLTFAVTFRTPRRSVSLLNETLPAAFGPGRDYNLGLPPAQGAPARTAQVPFEPLVAGPANTEGLVAVIPLSSAGGDASAVEARLAAEVRQVAALLGRGGPAAVGALNWGEICILAPRNQWLGTARRELEAAGLKAALQMRKNRNGDNPVYAWVCGLLAAVCDPADTFEWVGVLREVFAVSDALIAEALRNERSFRWDEPERYVGPLGAALAVLKPFVERVDAEGQPLERFATDLARACGLAAKAAVIDPAGELGAELERLVSRAAELGLEGAGPRAWRADLLASLEDGRPSGKPDRDAINLLTCHSAKGLEWPVVIPIGLWRAIGKREDTGLCLVKDAAGDRTVIYDAASMSPQTKEARERERLRELVRLLYVTLTRPRRVLALPWGEELSKAEKGSFADLWGADLSKLPRLGGGPEAPVPSGRSDAAPPLQAERAEESEPEARPRPALPERILPHALARGADPSRAARHESALDQPAPVKPGEDPLDYGIWWHETMEFLPWGADVSAAEAHGARALAAASALGFRERAAGEWARLLASPTWRELRDPRWTRLTELSVFSPLGTGAWIDGVIDFVLHDPAKGEI